MYAPCSFNKACEDTPHGAQQSTPQGRFRTGVESTGHWSVTKSLGCPARPQSIAMAKRPAESDDDSGSESSASASREEEEVATLSDEQLYKLQKQVRFAISFRQFVFSVQRAISGSRKAPASALSRNDVSIPHSRCAGRGLSDLLRGAYAIHLCAPLNGVYPLYPTHRGPPLIISIT